MANETPFSIEGNLTADPELRFTPSGVAVANFTIASTPRTFNKGTGEWEDGETLFMRGTAWREMAENVAESLTKGMGVVAIGTLTQKSYTDREGNKRTSIEMNVTAVGPNLARATARVTKRQKGQPAGGGGTWGDQQGGGWGGPQGAPQGGGAPGYQAAGFGGQGGPQGPQGGQAPADPWTGQQGGQQVSEAGTWTGQQGPGQQGGAPGWGTPMPGGFQ